MPEYKQGLPENENQENEPTSQELAEALRDNLDEETCAELASMDFADALGYAFTCLIEAGIEDPERLLIGKGILEERE